MHKILADLLEKRGIKDLTELSQEEKEQFDSWQMTLSDGEVTVDKIALFCQMQIKLIEARWKEIDLAPEKKAALIPYHSVYTVLFESITAPRAQRLNTEKYLTSLLMEK